MPGAPKHTKTDSHPPMTAVKAEGQSAESLVQGSEA